MEKIEDLNLFASSDSVKKKCGLVLSYGRYYTENSMRRGMQNLGGKILSPKDFEWTDEYEKVLQWVMDNKGRGLCMMGNCGTGKTLMLKLLSHMISQATRGIRNGLQCIGRDGWLSLPVYPAESINSIDKTLANAMESKSVLFLDDVGREPRMTFYGNTIDRFPEIVDRIERDGGTIVMTTNLSGEQLRERYGERTTDRLRGMCMFVTFLGESKRGGVR